MTTVVITGADHPTGLGTARALAKQHCRIIGIYCRETPCCKSKHWSRLVQLEEYGQIVDLLVSLGKESAEKSVLFMTQDNVVKLVSDQRERLLPYYLFHLPDKNVVDAFLDKTSFHVWALEHGFNVPASHVCASHEELADCLDRIPFPVIIKPFEKTEKWEKLSPVHKILQLTKRSELEQIPFNLFEAAPRLLVQQWIPGGDSNVYFCLVYYDDHGKKVADFTGRKLFQWPPLCGSTAAAISEENEHVRQVTEQLFNQAGYQGLGSLEFKRSDADGQYYIIEPTVGRNDLQSNIALAGGVNLTAFALAGAVGSRFPEARKKKAAWINEEGLLDALRACRREQRVWKSDVLKVLKPSMQFANFAIGDPYPIYHLMRSKFRR